MTAVVTTMMSSKAAEAIPSMPTMVPETETDVRKSIAVAIVAPGVPMTAVVSVTVPGLLHHSAVFNR